MGEAGPEQSVEAAAPRPPAVAEEPVEQAVGEVHAEPPATADEPTTVEEEAGEPPPEEMPRHLLAAWTKPQSGYALLEEQMARPSFRKMLIARAVKKLRRLSSEPETRTEIAKALVEETELMDSLADDIARELSDELEDDPEMLEKIVDVAVASPQVKQRIVKKLVEELND